MSDNNKSSDLSYDESVVNNALIQIRWILTNLSQPNALHHVVLEIIDTAEHSPAWHMSTLRAVQAQLKKDNYIYQPTLTGEGINTSKYLLELIDQTLLQAVTTNTQPKKEMKMKESLSKPVSKFVRDGKVAVLYSKNSNAGYTTALANEFEEAGSSAEAACQNPLIVGFILRGDYTKATEVIRELYGIHYHAANLTVAWVPFGHQFRINQIDGLECMETFSKQCLFTA